MFGSAQKSRNHGLDERLTRSHGEEYNVDIIWIREDVHEEDSGEGCLEAKAGDRNPETRGKFGFKGN